jgi:hypothetical protein
VPDRHCANLLTRTQLYCLEHGIQPDGYLTEERKAKDDDHGFSTFFSETGASSNRGTYSVASITNIHQARASTSRVPSTPIWSPTSSTRSAPAPTDPSSTRST